MKDRPADHLSIVVVVATVAFCTVVGLLAMVVLTFVGKVIPDPLDRLVTLLAGGLLGLIAKTSAGPQEVVNAPNDALDVDPNP